MAVLLIEIQLPLRIDISFMLRTLGQSVTLADTKIAALEILNVYSFNLVTCASEAHPTSFVQFAMVSKSVRPRAYIMVIGTQVNASTHIPFVDFSLRRPVRLHAVRRAVHGAPGRFLA
jgi:hypothetical protein